MKLSKGQSRGLAFGILVSLVAALSAGVAMPMWKLYQAGQDEIETRRDNIRRYESIGARLPALLAAQAALRDNSELERQTLSESSTALAAAALQDRVKTVVESNGGNLVSTQVLPVVDDGPYRRVTVNVRINAATESVQKIFHSLEGSSPLLQVDQLSIVSRQRATGVTQIDLLDVRFNLSGFMAPVSKEAS